MKITLTNALEAGMPEEMIENCRQLIERRIQDTMQELPAQGTDVTILYSDKDPLGKTDQVDDTAYFIYFTVEKAEKGRGNRIDDAAIELALMN